MSEMIRDGRNRNRRNSSGYAAGRNGAGGLQWPGTARRDARSCACRCMHARQQAGTMGASSTRQGNRRPGGSTGQEFSVLLPGRTGESSGLQVRSTCACTQGKGGARSGGNGGRGLGPAAAWLAARKKQQGGGVYIGGDGELLACAPREGSGLGRRGSDCDQAAKKRKREMGRTVDFGRKDFSYFSFCKKIQTNSI